MSDFTSDPESAVCGGIDLGGSKIAARLFDPDLTALAERRIATPAQSYRDLLDALDQQVAWLRQTARQPDLPVGIGLPGLVDPQTGRSLTSNLPASGQPLGTDLRARSGGLIRFANDCKCFCLSEARGGAGAGYRTVFGLILGTGVGGGVAINGALMPGPNRLAGEIGHAAIPATIAGEHALPLHRCGCGRTGCFETYLSGPGMTRLAVVLGGPELDPPAIVARAADGDPQARRVFQVWLRLAAELLHGLQLHLDPDCVVLGGGLSNIDGLDRKLGTALASSALPGLRQPVIRHAVFGDASGARGAAGLVWPLHDEGAEA